MANTQSMKFEIPGKPTGKQRHRSYARGKFIKNYTPEKTVNYENLVRLMFEANKPKDWDREGYFSVRICYHFKTPDSFSKKKKIQALFGFLLPDKKPDIDNGLKINLDGLNGAAWHDDKQVVHDEQIKVYGKDDYVSISISNINTNLTWLRFFVSHADYILNWFKRDENEIPF